MRTKMRAYDVFLLIIIILLVAMPFYTSPFHLYLATEIMIYSILAIAYAVLLGHLKLLSLYHGIFYGFGGYGVAWMIMWYGGGFWEAFLFGVAIATAVGLVIALISLRVRGAYYIIFSLVLGMIFYLWAMSAAEITGGSDGFTFSSPLINLGFITIPLTSTVKFYLSLIFLLITFFVFYRILFSPLGLTVRAVGEDEDKTGFLGYKPSFYRYLILVLSSLFTGVSGALYSAMFGFVNASFFSVHISISALLWGLVGGISSLIGPVIGVAFITILFEEISTVFEYYWIIGGIILIVVTMRFQEGILGYIKKRLPKSIYSRVY